VNGSRPVAAGGRAVPGTLAVLACPPALSPHLEFAVAAVLATPVSLLWSQQPAMPGMLRATLEWDAKPGTAGRLASKLRTLGSVRFDVVELPSAGCDAERYSFEPALGLHRADLAADGSIVVREEQLQLLLAAAAGGGIGPDVGLVNGVRRLLGVAWDDALEPLRQGGDGGPVTALSRTG
jgi:hypothetical protein